MSRLLPFAPSPPLRRLGALFLVLFVAVPAVTGTGRASGQDDYEPDPQVLAAVHGYARETNYGYYHVLRWMRVLQTFGALRPMTAAEAEDYADLYDATRWDPVMAELTRLESGQSKPDPQVLAAVHGYARETNYGYYHVLRWMRVLNSFGALEPMTAAEAQAYAEQHRADRWDPVVAELTALESPPADTPEPTPDGGELQVSISADPAHPKPGEMVKLRATIANAPESKPSYAWLLDFGGGQGISLGRAATASFASGNPGATSFLLTVSYTGGISATSSITVEWSDESPNQAPVPLRWADNYLSIAGDINAPPATLVSKPFYGVFSDPDGDELTYTAELTSGNADLIDQLSITLPDSPGVPSSVRVGTFPRLFLLVEGEAGWKAISPALPDPMTFTVRLTATDPGGLSTSLTSDFVTNWASDPELVSARADRQAVDLTFDLDLQTSPAPAPSQFTVNVTNEDGTTRTIDVTGVTVQGKVLTLELATAIETDQTVSVDYAHDDQTPIQRAGGGDSVPGFDSQTVELDLSLPPVDFEANPVLGTLDLLATWDEAAGATSYKLRWRQAGGEFDADNARTASGEAAVITVSALGQWEVRLQACNDDGCGPETSRTVDVAQALNLDLSRTRDSEGNVLPRTLTATWNPVPGATSYTLTWQRIGQSSQTQNQQRSAASGLSGANGEGDNQLTVPADRTGADFTVPDDSEYRARLQANNGDGRVITEDTASVNQDQTDTTPPRIVGGQIDGDRMTIFFSEPMDETATGGRFIVSAKTGNCVCRHGGVSPGPLAVSGNKVTVDFKGRFRAIEGLWALAMYDVAPSESKSLRDLAGNRLPTPRSVYTGSVSSMSLYLENVTGRPHVLPMHLASAFGPSGVAITSDPGADRAYMDDDAIQVTLRFSEAVDVTGTPRIKIDLDPGSGGEQWAAYAGGSGTKTLTFEYTVNAGDYSREGVAVLKNTLELNGGAIRSASAIGVENARLGHGGLDHSRMHRIFTSTSPPTLDAATVSGATLTLSFSEALDAAASLANSAFTVKKTPQGGSSQRVSLSGTPAISGDTLTLSLDSAVLATDSGVMVSYEKPASGTNNKLVDADGNETESFTDQPVTNTIDTTPPELMRVELDGDTLTLFFSEALDETTGGKGDLYRITLQLNSIVDGAPTYGRCRGGGWYSFTTEPREVHIRGNTVVVVGLKGDENSKWRSGVGQRTNNLYYIADVSTPADQRLRDLSGNHVRTPDRREARYWWTKSYTAVGVTELPSPERITVDGDRLVLVFDHPLDVNSIPAVSAFTVKVGGSAVNLAATNPVDVSGRTVTLTLASAVAQGASVTVTYAKPSASPLQNVICEDATAFTDEPASNLTGS